MRIAIAFMVISLLTFVVVAGFVIAQCDDEIYSIFLTLSAIGFAVELLFLAPIILLALKNKNRQRNPAQGQKTMSLKILEIDSGIKDKAVKLRPDCE